MHTYVEYEEKTYDNSHRMKSKIDIPNEKAKVRGGTKKIQLYLSSFHFRQIPLGLLY